MIFDLRRMPAKRIGLVLLAALLMLTIGCSHEKSPGAGKMTKGSVASSGTATNVIVLPPARPVRSVFSLEESTRDPFFPNVKKVGNTTTVAVKRESTAPGDLSALLQSDFIGVSGVGERRMAVFKHALLEKGKRTELTVSGRRESMSVRCLEANKNNVVLEVKGLAQPVTLLTPKLLEASSGN